MMVATSVSVLSIWVRFQVNVCFIPKLFKCSERVSIKKKIIIYYLSYIAYVFICIVKKKHDRSYKFVNKLFIRYCYIPN